MSSTTRSPKQNAPYCEVEQVVAITDNSRKLQVVPFRRRPAPRRRDLGARLNAILVKRFQARGLPNLEARIRAELCLGFSPERDTDYQMSRRKIVVIR
jgi:hypothetical protein